MQQLSGLDAGFLNLETPVQQGNIGGLVVIDPATAPGTWGFETLRRVVEERLHLLPPFRRRLVTVPLDLDRPYWIDDPHFDLSFHLRHIAVPPPGSPNDVAELVARIHERPLDRTRPLWEMYLIEGLADGRVATYTKIHHAAVDGVSGAEILTTLLDPEPEGRAITPAPTAWEPETLPNSLGLLMRSVVRMARSPAQAMRFGYEMARALPGLNPLQSLPALVGLGHNREEVLSRPTLIAPYSLLNRPITPHRRWAFGDVPLDRVKPIKNAAGTTVNDVVIAISAGAVRRWMSEHGELPDASLQAMIPISIRTETDRDEVGNRVSTMIAPIGTHLADPVERLQFVHHTMDIAKEMHDAVPALMLQDLALFAPPAIAARAAQLVFRNGRVGRWTPFNLVISNVPGPPVPLYLGGARVEGYHTVSTIIDGAALNITLYGYLGALCFGLVADRELVPDLWTIMQYIEAEVAELEERLT